MNVVLMKNLSIFLHHFLASFFGNIIVNIYLYLSQRVGVNGRRESDEYLDIADYIYKTILDKHNIWRTPSSWWIHSRIFCLDKFCVLDKISWSPLQAYLASKKRKILSRLGQYLSKSKLVLNVMFI